MVLEPWISGFKRTALSAFRDAQLAAAALPRVGFAMGTDIGDPTGPFGSVHPRNKKLVGRRLANAALTLQYGTPLPWQPPAYASATAAGAGAGATALVTLSGVPTTLALAADHCKTELKVDAAQCAGFYLVGSDGQQYAAAAALGGAPNTVALAAALPPGVRVAGTTFGYSTWPINTVMSAEGLPLMPWNTTLL